MPWRSAEARKEMHPPKKKVPPSRNCGSVIRLAKVVWSYRFGYATDDKTKTHEYQQANKTENKHFKESIEMMDQGESKEEIPCTDDHHSGDHLEYDPAEPFAQNDECAVDRRGKEPFQYQCISEVEEHERYTEDTAAEQEKPNCPGRIKSIVLYSPDLFDIPGNIKIKCGIGWPPGISLVTQFI